MLILPTELIKIDWGPGHSQIHHGNEQADTEAKKGTLFNIPPIIYPADFFKIETAIKNTIKSHWRTKWESYKAKYHLGCIIKQPLCHHNIQNSSQKMVILFAQLQLGSTRLNSSLFKIRQADFSLCQDCPVPETLDHYFFECRKFQNERDTLVRKLWEMNITVLYLETLLNDPRTLTITEQFVVSLKRFVLVPKIC